MAIFVPWLVDAARLTGYPVVEITGWKTRGHGGMTSVEGVVCHHTAGPKAGEYPSLAVVRDGRAGLAGPLANYGLGRSGTIYVVASGTAWHAGPSTWAGLTNLNSRFLGIEAEDDGDGTWTREQLDCYPRLVAALLHYMRRDASRACAHRECATPKGRKPDPTGIDMNALRRTVAGYLADPTRLIPRGGAVAIPSGGTVVSTPSWNTPVDDPYTPKAGDTIPAGAALAWAAANAGFARDAALQASTKAAAAVEAVGRVDGKADQIVATLGEVAAKLDDLIDRAAVHPDDNPQLAAITRALEDLTGRVRVLEERVP